MRVKALRRVVLLGSFCESRSARRRQFVKRYVSALDSAPASFAGGGLGLTTFVTVA